ncbi:MAG: Do family serine endopeptidase [Synergistaceae bacterium]|nr:Do family serine endopeptidase [Synergistaceae bacterium]MBQ6982685.1 Do family serine endopeptidase [Synergistaceae bacterium]
MGGYRIMRTRKILAFTLAFILTVSGSAFALSPFSTSQSNPIVPIVKRASVAVVNIDVEKTARRSVPSFPFDDDPFFKRFFGDSFKEFTRSVPMKGRGSGFIVSKEGQILTNNHVVDGVDKITVSLQLEDGSKKTYPAKILGNDPTYDLAVIKIEPDGNLPVLELGDSDAVEVGEFVVAIGNPYGFEHSVTAGVISAKNRSIHAQDVNFDDFLQTDAAINPGNSGGPLLNMAGEVVGINTAIIPYAQGLGFAIPVNKAKEIMGDLVSFGRVKRGWLGVSVRGITPEMAKAYGVTGSEGAMINDVFKGDPADKAGIKRGDVVVELNGKKVKDANDFVSKIRTLAPNSIAKLQVVRKGKKMTFNVKLAERNSKGDGSIESSEKKEVNAGKSDSINALRDFGISRVSPLTESLRRQYRINSDSEGLVITEIDKDSQASADGDIREGDLIIEVNGHEVKSASDLSKAVGDDNSIVLMIEREGSTYFLMVSKGSIPEK